MDKLTGLSIILLGVIITVLSSDIDNYRDSFAQLPIENHTSTGQNKWSTYFEGNKDYQLCGLSGCNDAVHIAYESPTTLTIYSKNIIALSKAVDEIKKDGYKIEGVISPTVVDTSPSIIMGK